MGSEMEFVSLRNEFLFHLVFTRNEVALRGLLGALLKIPEERIERTEVLNPALKLEALDIVAEVLDVEVDLNDGTYIIAEILVRKTEHWKNRALVYACRQLQDLEHNYMVHRKDGSVRSFTILDHKPFLANRGFFGSYGLHDDEGHQLTDILQFSVVDLTLIGSATEEDKTWGLVEWGKAFIADSWDELNGIQNAAVKEAAKTMQLIMANPDESAIIRRRNDAGSNGADQ